MAPVVAAALISAAASMAKAQADKKANSQGGGNNYQVDIKAPTANGNANSAGMQIETYKPQDSGGNSNTGGALIDAASDVIGKAVTSKMESSDERLKNIFGDNEDIIKIFSKIDAIEFKYNDKAHETPDAEEHGVDNDLHLGIKAQDLEKNPLTESAVSEDEHGHKIVDTKELTMANSAVISEICKRLEAIEKALGMKVV